jgi:hypothetical protein
VGPSGKLQVQPQTPIKKKEATRHNIMPSRTSFPTFTSEIFDNALGELRVCPHAHKRKVEGSENSPCARSFDMLGQSSKSNMLGQSSKSKGKQRAAVQDPQSEPERSPDRDADGDALMRSPGESESSSGLGSEDSDSEESLHGAAGPQSRLRTKSVERFEHLPREGRLVRNDIALEHSIRIRKKCLAGYTRCPRRSWWLCGHFRPGRSRLYGCLARAAHNRASWARRCHCRRRPPPWLGAPPLLGDARRRPLLRHASRRDRSRPTRRCRSVTDFLSIIGTNISCRLPLRIHLLLVCLSHL